MRGLLILVGMSCLASGCALVPEVAHQPRFHNPFPQLSRVAVLPFFNQSGDPTLNGLEVANAYRTELQQIPGFEVMPVGVVDQKLRALQSPLDERTDFQQLARDLGVDVVVVGSITDFDAYYPPRMGIAVNWFAANPAFQPIPPGFGLPWGTPEQEFIPDSLARDAEFALARERLSAATPYPNYPFSPHNPPVPAEQIQPGEEVSQDPTNRGQSASVASARMQPRAADFLPQQRPIIELVRQYDGHDAELTDRLANYFRWRCDERAGGWQAYLQRKDDFMRFCCYLHITEILAARGGAGETRVLWRWPSDRYEP